MRNVLVLVLVLVLGLAGCGPRPSVESFTPRPGATFVVAAIVKNEGGAGQVEVVVTLTDPATRSVIGRKNKDIEMKADERQHVVVEIEVPKETKVDPKGLAVAVQANYPVE